MHFGDKQKSEQKASRDKACILMPHHLKIGTAENIHNFKAQATLQAGQCKDVDCGVRL